MWLGRALLYAARPFIYMLMRVRVVGRENFPPIGTPLVLCCNHISNWDPIILEVTNMKRHVHFMAKAELFRNPIIAWFLEKQFGAFRVHRGKGDTDAIAEARKLVQSGKLMGIFPEGTRSKTGEMLRPKSGAAVVVSQTEAWVIPTAVVTKHQKARLFRPVTVVYGKPLSPEELHLADKEHPDIRYATRRIMSAIAELIETHG